jgi:hypothetical protein
VVDRGRFDADGLDLGGGAQVMDGRQALVRQLAQGVLQPAALAS